MARFLAWSPEAAEDVERIALYIERDSIHYARAVASRIVATAESIPDNPELGRMVPEINDPEYRERFAHKAITSEVKRNCVRTTERGEDASKLKSTFHARPNWQGKVSVWDGDNFEIEFADSSRSV